MVMSPLTVETQDSFSSLLEYAANNDVEGFKRSIEKEPSLIVRRRKNTRLIRLSPTLKTTSHKSAVLNQFQKKQSMLSPINTNVFSPKDYESGNLKGFAYVDFAHRDALNKAIDLS
ncbi:putative nucleotide-binding alpha-beta plait domain superfamily, RNA-binding domain superfamily [Helianthus anomalus]